MKNNYKKTFIDKNVSFRTQDWFRIRLNHFKETDIIWLKTNRMMFDDGVYNSKTPILIFKN